MLDDEDDEPLEPGAAAQAERTARELVDVTLADLLTELAAADGSIQVRAGGGLVDYAAHGVVFAAIEGRTASFRLRPEVAAAALRTDGVRSSPRGREWVAFAPRRFDRFALDRATAWFALAHRLTAAS